MDAGARQESYATFGDWLIAQLRLDLAPFHPVVPADLAGLSPEVFQQAEADYHQFFCDLLADMVDHPVEYDVPQDVFLPTIPENNRLLSEAEKQQAAQIRAARLKARKAVAGGWLVFLSRLGQLGRLEGWTLVVDQSTFQSLVEEKRRANKTAGLLQAFERHGCVFTGRDGVVRVDNSQYPHMLAALVRFSQECAKNKVFGAYFFRRCDFRVFAGASQPGFDDALRLAPAAWQPGITETDRLLTRLKYKREVLVSEEGGGYRLRYSRKGGQRVYWCRIRTPDLPVFYHHLRWDLGGPATLRLFERLEAVQPGLSGRVLAGIKKCSGCFENCMALAEVDWDGARVACCSEVGWEVGESDFEALHAVLNVLEEIGG